MYAAKGWRNTRRRFVLGVRNAKRAPCKMSPPCRVWKITCIPTSLFLFCSFFWGSCCRPCFINSTRYVLRCMHIRTRFFVFFFRLSLFCGCVFMCFFFCSSRLFLNTSSALEVLQIRGHRLQVAINFPRPVHAFAFLSRVDVRKACFKAPP